MNNYDINGNEDKNKIYISDDVFKQTIQKTLYDYDDSQWGSIDQTTGKVCTQLSNEQNLLANFFVWIFKKYINDPKNNFDNFFSKQKEEQRKNDISNFFYEQQMDNNNNNQNTEQYNIQDQLKDSVDNLCSPDNYVLHSKLQEQYKKFQEYNEKINHIKQWKNIQNDNNDDVCKKFFENFNIATRKKTETKLFNELLSHIDDSYNARNKGFVVGRYFVKQVTSSNPLFNKRFIVLDVDGNITEIKIDRSIVKNKDNTNDNGKGLQDFKNAIQKAAEKKLTPTTFQSKYPNNNQG